jgi:hypothetical protein
MTVSFPLLVEPKEKLRIKGGFGVTAAAKARVRALNRAASSDFHYPALDHLTPKPLQRRGASPLMQERRSSTVIMHYLPRACKLKASPWAIVLIDEDRLKGPLHKYYNYYAY